MLSEYSLLDLANKIKAKIRQEFVNIHLSKNLMDTIEVKRTTMGYEIEIPAEIYDLDKWYNEKVIVYTGEGSYAQQVNIEGGFSGTHQNYVEKAIQDAINEWIKERKYNVKKVDVL